MEAHTQYPLAPLTTLKIGGPADTFVQTDTNEECIDVIKDTPLGTPITILGNGSNVLISDTGIRGLVIRNLSKNISILSDSPPKSSIINHTSDSDTHRTENEPQKYLNFAALDYDESDQPKIQITLDAGVPLPYAINYLISQGITGLQWFAYIPGTIGGATCLNIHGGKYNLSSYIESISAFDRQLGEIKEYQAKDLDWRYEHSFFRNNPHLYILSTTFNLYQGDAAKAKAVAAAWIAQKSKVQPMNSAGSVFQNPSLEDATRLWGEQKSAGWIIDHELGWKGKSFGGAQISPLHSNFIVNTGNCTAADYLSLAHEIQDEVKKRFNLDLKMEVKLLGDFV